MARPAGIEPALTVLETAVLPLYEGRKLSQLNISKEPLPA